MKYPVIAISAFYLLMTSCGKTEPAPQPSPKPVPDPAAATLVFPDSNSECNEGTVQSETQSKVTFQWNASENTDSYELHLKNLDTNTTQVLNATTNEKEATLERGAPYEWYVVSKAGGTTVTATSTTWKFYNEGPGIENYAPFPAEVVSPGRGATIAPGDISLEWTASDVDDDIVGYEILFGTDPNPSVSLGTSTTTTMAATVTAGQVYYWQVLTSDAAGNVSASDIFDFRVE